MLRFASKILFLALTAAVTVSIVPGQDTVKQVVKNADGTYTVIEYPVGKEVTVSLLPSTTVSGGILESALPSKSTSMRRAPSIVPESRRVEVVHRPWSCPA